MPRSTPKQQPRHLHTTPEPPVQQPELVDPRWILKAFGAVILLALVCAYATLCLLFVQGQWQLVLHPSRTVSRTPAAFGLAFNEVHFFDAASGEPQLDGWLIPGSSASPSAVILHGADGTMSDALPDAVALHNAGLSVLLFDYRGYGRSTGAHPNETSMQEDSEAALNFLTSAHHQAVRNIVVYGTGVGASLAVRLASEHHDVPALVLDAPDGDFAERARSDPRAHLVPTRWLFDQTFPLATPLQELATPKLLIANTTSGHPPVIFERAADPKITIELSNRSDPSLVTTIRRFVDQYVPSQNAQGASGN